jgi:type 1 glutamine amidotransferase
VLVTKWSAAPIKSEHPILCGITPWVYEQEEFFFKETMPPDPRRTPLLAVTRPAGDAETVSWAVEREGGGRGFVFTGSDFHKNMEILQHRRMLLNGVLWAARIEIPGGGASCSVPEELLK